MRNLYHSRLLPGRTLIFVSLYVLISASLSMAGTGKHTLISPRIFFSNPEKTAPSLSSDGNKVAFLAPLNGKLNLWLSRSDTLARAKPITKLDEQQRILSYFWTANDNYLFYLADRNGDENSHLYRVDLHTAKTEDLTPFSGVQARLVGMSPKFPNELLVGLNKRNLKWHDVYRLNIVTGKLALIEKNNCFRYFIADLNLQLRIAKKISLTGEAEYYTKNKNTRWQLYEKVSFREESTTSFGGFDEDGVVYQKSAVNRDKAAIYAIDLYRRQKTLIAESSKADCDSLLVHPRTHKPQLFAYEYDKLIWKALDPKLSADLAYLEKYRFGSFEITSRSLDDNKWIVCYYGDVQPSAFYLYDRKAKNSQNRLIKLFVTRPELTKLKLLPMQPKLIKTRDGLEMISYLTVPACSKKLLFPTVLLVHGGPWKRDSWGLNYYHQWLANRGYAVLSVNFRGSTGFGKAFVNAGNKEWGGKMQDDLVDAVRWAIENRIADPQKVAIMGESYGGYAALMGVALAPNQFCCAISIAGPTDLVAFIKNIPPYWRTMTPSLKYRIGNIGSKRERESLLKHSPMTYAGTIKAPLLIIHGENDCRVKKMSVDQFVTKLQHFGTPVKYVTYPNEGHNFRLESNRLALCGLIEEFLDKHLGGRS